MSEDFALVDSGRLVKARTQIKFSDYQATCWVVIRMLALTENHPLNVSMRAVHLAVAEDQGVEPREVMTRRYDFNLGLRAEAAYRKFFRELEYFLDNQSPLFKF